MCGIAGYAGLDLALPEGEALLRRMCASLVHRGPDDEGVWAGEGVGLGMRRLSIIDLAGGHQPIATDDGDYRIVFNGEIYNYRELRRDLEGRGHVFRTATDTEVILRQYIEDGPDCVDALNGMFAFALWDRPRRRLFLARDRLGIKPLYLARDGARLAFASEIKALLAVDLAERRVDEEALWDYLTFRYVPGPRTIWAGVESLPPGHTLLFENGRAETRRYWDIPRDPSAEARPEAWNEDWDEEFARLFLDAVRYRLIADVPVGILLSGGLDSSAVAAAVAEVHNVRLRSFSVAFAGAEAIDERPYARQAAERLGTEHEEVVIDAGAFLDFLPSLVRFTDQPLADLAAVPLHYVAHLARRRVTVVLSGEGSDEILGGYDLDAFVRAMDRCRRYRRLPGWLRGGLIARVARRMGHAGRAWLNRLETPLDLRAWKTPPLMSANRSAAEKARLWAGGTDPGRDSLDTVRAEVQRAGGGDPLGQYLYSLCQSWLVEDLLMKADRMSMANGLELRVPFLDHRLVEWAARAPAPVKVGRDADGVVRTKRVLRRFVEPRLPASIRERPKMGFPVPVYDWLADRLKPWAEDLLASSDAVSLRWFDRAAVREEFARGTAPEADPRDRRRLWDLLLFELWCREWDPA